MCTQHTKFILFLLDFSLLNMVLESDIIFCDLFCHWSFQHPEVYNADAILPSFDIQLILVTKIEVLNIDHLWS